MSDQEIRFHPVVAALYDPVQSYFERYQAPEHREYLADGVTGEVLEVGLGTGAMFPYYGEQTDETTNFHGVEPDPGMWRQAREKIDEQAFDMELVCGRVESLPYEDDAFDYVIECGLFCSVPSIETALAEIGRVLAPDGTFRFFDHVRSAGLVGRSQDLLTPLWRKIGGNCHLNRRVKPVIEASDQLAVVEHEYHTVGYWPVREFVRGQAAPVSR